MKKFLVLMILVIIYFPAYALADATATDDGDQASSTTSTIPNDVLSASSTIATSTWDQVYQSMLASTTTIDTSSILDGSSSLATSSLATDTVNYGAGGGTGSSFTLPVTIASPVTSVVTPSADPVVSNQVTGLSSLLGVTAVSANSTVVTSLFGDRLGQLFVLGNLFKSNSNGILSSGPGVSLGDLFILNQLFH